MITIVATCMASPMHSKYMWPHQIDIYTYLEPGGTYVNLMWPHVFHMHRPCHTCEDSAATSAGALIPARVFQALCPCMPTAHAAALLTLLLPHLATCPYLPPPQPPQMLPAVVPEEYPPEPPAGTNHDLSPWAEQQRREQQAAEMREQHRHVDRAFFAKVAAWEDELVEMLEGQSAPVAIRNIVAVFKDRIHTERDKGEFKALCDKWTGVVEYPAGRWGVVLGCIALVLCLRALLRCIAEVHCLGALLGCIAYAQCMVGCSPWRLDFCQMPGLICGGCNRHELGGGGLQVDTFTAGPYSPHWMYWVDSTRLRETRKQSRQTRPAPQNTISTVLLTCCCVCAHAVVSSALQSRAGCGAHTHATTWMTTAMTWATGTMTQHDSIS
jgi:hypothetical protein